MGAIGSGVNTSVLARFFIMEDKPYKTYEEQIGLLKARRLGFKNEAFAKRVLEMENYYNVINGYSEPFLAQKNPDVYLPFVDFEHIFRLYDFDKRFRNNLLIIILQVENTIKAIFSHEFAKKYGGCSYLDKTNYYFSSPIEENKVSACIAKLKEIIETKKTSNNVQDLSVKHYCAKHNSQIPIWVLFNSTTFGTVSKMYNNLKLDLQSEICAHLNMLFKSKLSVDDLKKYLRVLVEIRNICAHGQRLYKYTNNYRLNKDNSFIKESVKYNIKIEAVNLNMFFIALSQLTDRTIFSLICQYLIDDLTHLNSTLPDTANISLYQHMTVNVASIKNILDVAEKLRM